MAKNIKEIKVIDYVLKRAIELNKEYVETNAINFYKYEMQDLNIALKELEEYELIIFSSLLTLDSFKLTDKGINAAEIGYYDYWLRFGEKEKQKKELEEILRQKAFVDFNNAKNQKYGYWISIVMSAIALLISLYTAFVKK